MLQNWKTNSNLLCVLYMVNTTSTCKPPWCALLQQNHQPRDQSASINKPYNSAVMEVVHTQLVRRSSPRNTFFGISTIPTDLRPLQSCQIHRMRALAALYDEVTLNCDCIGASAPVVCGLDMRTVARCIRTAQTEQGYSTQRRNNPGRHWSALLFLELVIVMITWCSA